MRRNDTGSACGHRFIPVEITRVFGDSIASIHCPRCDKDMPYVRPKDEINDKTIPLIEITESNQADTV